MGLVSGVEKETEGKRAFLRGRRRRRHGKEAEGRGRIKRTGAWEINRKRSLSRGGEDLEIAEVGPMGMENVDHGSHPSR